MCSKVVNRPFVATSQSTNDRGVQMLRLNSNRLTLARTQLCTERADLNHGMGRFEENNMRVLELNVSPKFALMKQVLFDITSNQSTESSSAAFPTVVFESKISPHELSKIKKHFVPLFFNESINS